jgi:TRAP-type mannitol/chloroaromatic compound transport system permease small subunit|tara:strand:+ start:1871 stop:2305 length:435 start_codon:yes stop_codon:yes gene_type:complete
MMLITCLVVFLRYLLNMGSIALQESVTYLHGMVFLLGIAYTMKQKAHVRVDIIYQKLDPRTKCWMDLLGTLLFLFPVSIFITWVSIEYVQFSWNLLEGSAEPGGLPGVFLLKSLIPLMAVLLFLQGVAELLRNALILLAGPSDT